MYSLSQRGAGIAMDIDEPCVLVPFEQNVATSARCVCITVPDSEQSERIDVPWGQGLWLLLGEGTEVRPTGNVSFFGLRIQGAKLGLQTPATSSRG
jgi:hypothetical protein